MSALPPMETRRAETPLLFGLTALALAVRLPGLSDSFYGDEGFSLLRDSNQLLTPTEDRFRPLFFSLLYLWRKIGFHGEVGLRSLPLLFGILQVPVAFRLGRLLGGLRAAVVFAGLVALNPMLLEFSQELRMYSLVPLLALLQAWAFAATLARSRLGLSTLPTWSAFVAAGAAGVYTHFHYWFLLFGFSVAIARRRREVPLRDGILAMGSIALLYLPNIPNLLRFQREGAGAPHLLATDLPSAFPKLVAAGCVGFNYFNLPHLGITRAIRPSIVTSNGALSLLVAIPSVIVCWNLVRLHRRLRLDSMLWMSHELFTAPVLLSFCAVVALGRDFIHPKYMVASAPFLLLLLTKGYLAISRRLDQVIAGLTSAAVLTISMIHFNQPQHYGRREDWRGLACFLRSALDDESTLLWLGASDSSERMTLNGPPRTLWDYYGADIFPRIRMIPVPRPDASPRELSPIVGRLTEGERHVYYLRSEIAANVSDPHDAVIDAARSILFDEQKIQFNPRLILYRWERR